jgi:hypothetical protein
MTGWPDKPVIYEINTTIWLGDLSRAAGRRVTLADVPAPAWDDVTPDGIDAVWLMGVWERSPAGLQLANANTGLQASFRDALPDVRPDDVIGSPYCVRRYVVDDSFGGPQALAEARSVLAARGIRLLLDYVPNHVAPDHPWVTTRPELLVNGSEADIEAEPTAWVRAAGHILAYGRDPYFPPWPDVVQLDAFSPALRTATTQTLTDIAGQCDGIRCDMAMLMTNQVFAKTWGGRTGQEPSEEFWPAVIAGLRSRHPETVLIAEAYWDMEWTLQQQGFDFCYDKRLYDRIVGRDVSGVRDHLRADLAYQSRLVRFLENHDEPRIADLLPGDAERAAAVAIATLPGATLWHEGQFEGRRVRPPVFLSRRPREPADPGLVGWYWRLLAVVDSHRVRAGAWQLLEVGGWPDNDSCRNLLAWSWTADGADDGVTDDAGRHVVVVNLSGEPAQGRVALGWTDLRGRSWKLTDLLDDREFDWSGDELADQGLFVALPPWGCHLLAMLLPQPAGSAGISERELRMTTSEPGSDDELGPVDFLAIEFPGGRLTAPGFEKLLSMADQRVIEILDMEFIAKDADGKSKKVDVWEFAVPEGVDLTAWAGASSGLLDDSDVGEISAAMQPGSVAVVVIYENRWVLGLVDAWRRDGARLIADGGLSADDIVAALDATESS